MLCYSYLTVCTILAPVLDVHPWALWMVVAYNYGKNQLTEPVWIKHVHTSSMYQMELHSALLDQRDANMVTISINVVAGFSIVAKYYSMIPER